ncbi:MAG TPA: flagellar biosynthesis protein FlhF [Candidatus Cloacimonadota bacterium]|jgi:flagellar biosynthesis protein FlhF|nr:flagellar biosynthesis protein FlhF [Candidatus Cloacimonadales bacterium]HPY96636.1 flagellar biosynthesis protein FlhF [Candidatus Cloacimonadota bacterium]HQB41576.1 flagellar biosynthesis protein FlhF [Candidatus Cloacimonadota bacterium]
MKIKKFLAPSMQEALKMIKKEFGDDAIILSNKSVQLKEHPEWKNAIEVTAAIDKKDEIPSESFGETVKKAVAEKPEPSSISSIQFNTLQKDIGYINDRIELILNHIKYENLPHLPKNLQKYSKQLITCGVNASIANSIIEEVFTSLKGEDLMEDDLVEQKIITKMKNMIQITGPVKFNQDAPTVVLVMGSTGVGKTTSVAKLAALYKFTYRKRVALVSVDSFRIAAMEQLKAFSDIAKIHFEAAYSNNDLIDKINKLKNYDVILVDSAGINIKNIKQLIALKETIRVSRADEIHLILNMTTRYLEIKETLKSFAMIPYNGVILTKLDESSYFGDILNISVEMDKPFSYISFGQNIPEDISLANRNELAQIILRGKYDNQ